MATRDFRFFIGKSKVVILQLFFLALFLELSSFFILKSKILPDVYSASGVDNSKHLLNQGFDWRSEEMPWGAWHKSNFVDQHSKTCFDVEYVSNNIGARDNVDYPGEFNKNSIVLLGDSFAEGWGVDHQHTLAAYLQRISGSKVFNLGSAHKFGPLQYYLVYKNFAKLLPHSTLIIGFLPSNDFTDNDPQFISHYGSHRYRPYAKSRLEDEGYDIIYPSDSTKRPSLTRSGFTRFISDMTIRSNAIKVYRNIKILRQNPVSPASSDVPSYFSGTEDQQRAVIHYLDKIISFSKEEIGVKNIILFSIPVSSDFNYSTSSREISSEEPVWRQHYRVMSEKLDYFQFIDGLDLVRTLNSNEISPSSLFLQCDGHWSALGSRLNAELLGEYIK